MASRTTIPFGVSSVIRSQRNKGTYISSIIHKYINISIYYTIPLKCIVINATKNKVQRDYSRKMQTELKNTATL
jgi:hypothetical protein